MFEKLIVNVLVKAW